MTLKTVFTTRILFYLTLCVIAGLAINATLSAPSPEIVIKKTSKQMLKALEENHDAVIADPNNIYQLIDTIALPHFDIEAIVRSILGKFFRQATAEQHRAFRIEFQTLLMHIYAKAFLEYTDEKVRVFPVSPDALMSNRVKVQTLIEGKQIQPVSIIYRMHVKKGEWKIYDFSVEGVSLVLNYRQSFAEQIKKDGLDILIANLAEKNAEFNLYGD